MFSAVANMFLTNKVNIVRERFNKSCRFDTDELFKFIYRGGMPKAFGFTEEGHKDYLNAYILI
jgi:phospholipase/lecithinase/hemolysin